MGFSLESFFSTMKEMIDDMQDLDSNSLWEAQQSLNVFILEQEAYARECGNIK